MVSGVVTDRAAIVKCLDEGRGLLDDGMAESAARVLHDAARLALDLGDHDLRLAALIDLAEAHWRAPGPNAHEALWTTLLAATEHDDVDPRLLARATEKLARLATISRTSAEAMAVVETAERRLAAMAVSPTMRRAIERELAVATRVALIGSGDLGDRRRATRRMMASLDAGSDAVHWWTVHMWRLTDALESGDRARAEVELRACVDYAEEVGSPLVSFQTATWKAALAVLSADQDAASASIAAALEVVDGLEQDTSVVLSQIGIGLWERGELSEPIAVLRDEVKQISVRLHLHRALLADLLASDGQVDEANLEIDRLAVDGFSTIPRNGDWSMTIARISHAVCDLGRTDLVDPLRRLLDPYSYQVLWVGGMPIVCFGSIAWYTGRLAILAGDLEAAIADLERATDMHRRFGAPAWMAESHIDHARALLTRQRPEDLSLARSLLADAASIADRHGLTAIARRVEAVEEDPPGPVEVGPTFRASDDGWLIGFSDRPFHLPDSKGLRGLLHLIGNGGVSVPASVIVTDVLGEPPIDPSKARVNVTRQLRAAIGKIFEHDATLAGHLESAVATGRECAYRPAGDPPSWEL